MVLKKNKRKKNRTNRKTYKRNQKYKNRKNRKKNMSEPSFMISRNPITSADRAIVKLRYTSNIATGSLTTVSASYLYAGNGPALPIPGSGTRQPVGFDVYKRLYGKVLCHGSRIRLQILSAGNDASSYSFIAVMPSPLLYLSTEISTPTIQDVMATPYVKYDVFGANQAQNKTYITNYISTKKCLGKKSIDYSDDFASVTTSSQKSDLTPALPWYWNVYISSLNQVSKMSSNTGIYINVEIDYYCEFYDRFLIKDTNDILTDAGVTGPAYGLEPIGTGDTGYFDYGSPGF